MKQDLLFPSDGVMELAAPVNVASVPQRSPFRYPGGKTWLVPVFRRWMYSIQKPNLLIEAFAGGAIIGLTAAFENLAKRVLLIELDEQVAAVWQAVIDGDGEWLAQRILHFELSLESLKNELLQEAASCREKAFQTLLKNRTSHGGILADGAGVLKNGEAGRGLASRWYPRTLAQRLRCLDMVSDRLQFKHGDAFDGLRKYKDREDVAYFIDPPYTAGGKRAGKRLYRHSQIDHERLFAECEKVRGDFLMTYDNAPEVVDLAERHGFQTKAIAMKNTHHAEMTELLIGRDLSWF